MSEDIIRKLDLLAEQRARLDAVKLQFNDLRDSILPPDLRTKLEEIEAERETALSAIRTGIEQLETEIKSEVLALRQSVKGSCLYAVFTDGRVTWDTKALDVYALEHPRLLQFRKTDGLITPEVDTYIWAAKHGAKLSKKEAQLFFPEIKLPYRE